MAGHAPSNVKITYGEDDHAALHADDVFGPSCLVCGQRLSGGRKLCGSDECREELRRRAGGESP